MNGYIVYTIHSYCFIIPRARMVVECAFGHLARRFRVFEVLHTREEMTSLVVRSCIHLHNFIRLSRMDDEVEMRLIMNPPTKKFTQIPLPPRPFSNPTMKEDAEVNRHRLHLYLNTVGKLKHKSSRIARTGP